MTFLIFEQFPANEKQILRSTGTQFRLAGYNLLYKAWKKRGCPLNAGWSIDRNELLEIQFENSERPEGARLIIDFHPTSTGRIGLVEPLEIHAFTYGHDNVADWSPLMLKLHDVYYEEFDQNLKIEEKQEIMQNIPMDFLGQEFIEFLYVNGDERGWNWGRNGMTNAAFLHDDARNYFRQFF